MPTDPRPAPTPPESGTTWSWFDFCAEQFRSVFDAERRLKAELATLDCDGCPDCEDAPEGAR